jgi:hypothetical protein
MTQYRTRVIRGAGWGWQIERLQLGQWLRFPHVYSTRAKARADQLFYSRF